MSGTLTVSIVIVSRHRPDALRRCLMGVSQLAYTPFEVIIVADPASCAGLRSVPTAAHVKLLPFDQANISAARNAGVGLAAGEIIAFIDDDAVPEPTWLDHLAAPFADPTVMAAGGFVRGRNGISWQSRANSVDWTGQETPLDIPESSPTVLTPPTGRAIKTEGTNMALRRSALVALGGFDPSYRFFLDETDLNLRLAAHGWSTALVPLAQVHHGYLESARRRADRVPTDLTEIGASWGVFLTSHCPPDQVAPAWARVQTDERARLLRHMVTGALEPRDVGRLMSELISGYKDGLKRISAVPVPLPTTGHPFLPYPGSFKAPNKVFSGRIWALGRLRRKARLAVQTGHRASLFSFSHTALYHRVRFSSDGVWEQTGGLFGRSVRDQKAFRLWTFRRRVDFETERVAKVRSITG